MNKRSIIWSKAIALAVALAFSILTVLIQKTQAYDYSGCKWPTNNPVYDGHTLTSAWNTAVSNGRNQWTNVTPSPLNILRNDTSNNDVTLGSTGGTAGNTSRTCVGSTITDADITFNSAFTWYTGTGVLAVLGMLGRWLRMNLGIISVSNMLNLKFVGGMRLQDQPCVMVTLQVRPINAV